jgi:O-6-methylguanine DNA methyltransferase
LTGHQWQSTKKMSIFDSMSTYTGYCSCPLGSIEIEATEEALIAVKFLSDELPNKPDTDGGSPIISETIKQLEQYFASERKQFDVPLQLPGTDFQIQVWNELKHIPYGKTISYSQLADTLGSRDLVRAVGNANSKNPVAIIVPCHRVIGSQGDLVGYAGGLWRKQWLLEHEDCQQLLPIFQATPPLPKNKS